MRKGLLLALTGTFYQVCLGLPPTLVISIPKCGTHLIDKTVSQITGKKVVRLPMLVGYHTNLTDGMMRNKHPMQGHIHCNKENVKKVGNYKAQVVFIYRDPRDQVVSYSYWRARRGPTPFNFSIPNGLERKQARRQLLTFLIEKISASYKLFMPWAIHPQVLPIKFEDLVGARGGGSDEKQLQTIMKIAAHIGTPISEAGAKKIATQLFGGTWTFRKGQIGSWKKEFSLDQKALFKKHNSDLLIALGYETDSNW